MTTGKATMIPLLLFPLLLATVTIEVLGQHSANSLQAAIEALHRHHDILSSQRARHHDPSASHHQAEDYFTDDTDYPYGENLQQQQQGQLNRALANYLAREGQRERIPAHYSGPMDFDDVGDDAEELGGFDARKRSIFREREETPYKSVFREREQYAQPDLGEEFLEEMEREREEEEEDRYRDTLRRLWDKYQQQENSIERQLFEEQQQEERDAEDEDEEKRKRSFDLDDKRKKKRFGYIPMYIGPVPYKRRDYPMLPWLPAEDRKKRFPVAKRSAKPIPEEANVSGTSDKVAKDLQTLFGGQPAAVVADDKVKRSTEETAATAAKLPQGAHKVQKKSDHSFHEQEEEEEEEEDEGHEEGHEEHDHDHEEEGHEHEGDDEHEEDEDEDKKKKRAISEAVKSSPEIVKEDQIIPGDLSDYKKKKSVHWDKFLAFGYDKRKKKSVVGGLNGKYRSMMKRQARKKKEVDPEKIDSMDDKLKSIEDLIIEETVKYTGAHEGVSNPVEVQKLKDHVISRLATAYSLEKMRRALDQLRENVDTERHLQHNEIEPFDEREDVDGDEDDMEKKKKKRIAVKKDQADEEKHAPAHGHPEAEHEEPEDDEEKKRKKKRKRNGLDFELPENSLDQESGPAGYLEQSDRLPDYASASQCPLLNAMEKRCRGVDILSGDIHQELLPICAVHQLCYLCGTSQTSCDLQYLSDADTICGHNNKECEAAARSALMILRGAPGPQLGPRECARNSCLYHAIRDIAY